MTPNTSPPSKIGKPNAACSRSRAATGVRWKLASRTRSEMYLGLRLSHTLPGNPTPARKVLSRLADSNSGTSLDGLCQISTQRSTPASRSTRHSAPTSQPRHSPKARSIFGVASATVAEATPKILRALGECLGWDVGALWRVDREAGVLRCVEIWHKPSKEVPEFESASRERTFLAGVGLPGKVWLSRKPRYISDLVREANFHRTPVAARERLHAAFGFPILLGGEVLGVIEFFSREIRQPDQELLA